MRAHMHITCQEHQTCDIALVALQYQNSLTKDDKGSVSQLVHFDSETQVDFWPKIVRFTCWIYMLASQEASVARMDHTAMEPSE